MISPRYVDRRLYDSRVSTLYVPPRYRLSISDVILRGCQHEPPQRLLESMRAHYRHPDTRAEWGLSVAAMPGAAEEAVLDAAGQLRQSHYRVASVGDVSKLSDRPRDEIGSLSTLTFLSVVWDHNAHGLIVSRSEPTLELAETLAGLFGPAKVNPYYEERRRTRAGR